MEVLSILSLDVQFHQLTGKQRAWREKEEEDEVKSLLNIKVTRDQWFNLPDMYSYIEQVVQKSQTQMSLNE